MKTIQLQNGKTIDVEFGNNGTIKGLGSHFRLMIMKGEYVLNTLTASKELAEYFGVNVEKKPVSLRISDTTYSELKSELSEFTKKNEAEKQRIRNEYIASRPQKTVLMFSGWYLSDAPVIARMFQESNGEIFRDKQPRWYVAERICELPKIKGNDCITFENSETPTDFESNCFAVSPDQINQLIKLNNLRIAEKEKEKQEDKNKESERRNMLIAEAQKTGQKQILSSYIGDCDNSVTDCSFDQIVTWIDSEGKLTISRSHCH
jgi:hypothetical protein